ncbi:MAG: hypothetical protein WC683_15185 [bacterium]
MDLDITRGIKMDVTVLGSVRASLEEDYKEQLVIISTTPDKWGRIYFESESGVEIGIDIPDLMKAIGDTLKNS